MAEEEQKTSQPTHDIKQSPYYYLGILAGAVVIFGFSFWQVQNRIKSPFELKPSNDAKASQNSNLTKTELEQAEELKKMDTDQDGLSDYLEKYVYGTSAYLDDSDSDGIKDLAEILGGKNPNCNSDEGCDNNISVPSVAVNLDGEGQVPIDNETDLNAIKTSLVQIGFSQEELNAMSEEELRTLYAEASAVFASGESLSGSVDGMVSYDQFKNLSVDEIKELLKSGGATEEDLAKISDEQLLEIYQQVLAEQFNQNQ